MGAPSKAVAYIELEDYLVLENASRYKHEYLDGVIYAIQGEPVRGMAGGQRRHTLESSATQVMPCTASCRARPAKRS